MIIALPVAGNQLCMHFGHCEKFAFYDIDPNEKKIKGIKMLIPPPHEPGILPPWIKQQGADLVITGGMGARARALFEAAGVHVITGAPAIDTDDVVTSYLNDTLELGQNTCDH